MEFNMANPPSSGLNSTWRLVSAQSNSVGCHSIRRGCSLPDFSRQVTDSKIYIFRRTINRAELKLGFEGCKGTRDLKGHGFSRAVELTTTSCGFSRRGNANG